MSIQKFDSLIDGNLFYINKDVIEQCVYSGVFDRYKKEAKIRYKTTWVIVKKRNRIDLDESFNHCHDCGKEVEVCNKDCYRTLKEAIEARIKRNEELAADLAAKKARARIIINHLKTMMPSLEETLKYILERAELDENEAVAIAEQLQDFIGVNVSGIEVGSQLDHEFYYD